MALLLNAIARLEAELDGEGLFPVFDQKDELTIDSIIKRIRESDSAPADAKSEPDPRDAQRKSGNRK